MKRWMIIGGLAVTLTVVGCSKSEPTASTASMASTASTSTAADGATPTTTAGGAPVATLSLNDCVGVTTANYGVVSGKAEDADKLKSYNPPSEVTKAADLIVSKGGIKLTGTDGDVLAAAQTLTDWVDAVCPS